MRSMRTGSRPRRPCFGRSISRCGRRAARGELPIPVTEKRRSALKKSYLRQHKAEARAGLVLGESELDDLLKFLDHEGAVAVCDRSALLLSVREKASGGPSSLGSCDVRARRSRRPSRSAAPVARRKPAQAVTISVWCPGPVGTVTSVPRLV